MSKIIGISGYCGAGKDTVASILLGALDGSTANSFAAPMRIVAEHLGLSLIRDYKERSREHVYRDFDDRLIGALRLVFPTRHNVQAELFALVVDALTDGAHLVRCAGYDILRCSPREFLQILGTAGRTIDPDFWVREFERKTSAAFTIASDLRMPNEVEACHYVVFVDRPGTGRVNDAASEQHYEDIRRNADCVIDNSADFYHLAKQVHALAKELS